MDLVRKRTLGAIMLKPEDLELHIGKFVKISVFHGGDLVVTSYGTISYDDIGWRVAGDIGDYGYSIYFKPESTRILEGPEELHLIYEI